MTEQTNPFFDTWNAPFGVPPFDRIELQHYLPAFERGMREHLANVETIAVSPDEPSFENTLEALERAGSALDRVLGVFYNQTSAHTNDALQKIQAEMAPKLVRHNSAIQMNAALFKRIETLHEKRSSPGLNFEQLRLLEETHKNFVRAGAALDEDAQGQLKAINEEISVLTTKFGQNSLAETNDFQLVLGSEDDVAGLPDSIRADALETGRELGRKSVV